MELICDNCGKIEKALLNGYDIGDTLLEDVIFEITIEKDGNGSDIIKVKCEDSLDYFKQFNQDMFLKKAYEYTISNDAILICQKCQGDVELCR